MQEKTVTIPNIMCGHCVMTIKRELGEIEGVKEVEADAATKKTRIRWDNPADWEQITMLLSISDTLPRKSIDDRLRHILLGAARRWRPPTCP